MFLLLYFSFYLAITLAQVAIEIFFTFSVHASTALLSFHAFCLWSKTDLMMGGKRWKPQRAWSGTRQMPASSMSSIDTYLPCLQTSVSNTDIHTNKPLGLDPPRILPTLTATETFSQLWSNRQSTKRTCCFTDTHLPLPLSPVCAWVLKSRTNVT